MNNRLTTVSERDMIHSICANIVKISDLLFVQKFSSALNLLRQPSTPSVITTKP